MINIADIMIEDNRWSDFGLQAIANKTFGIVFNALNLSNKWEISVLACNDAKITQLNFEYRNKAQTTNVLSWPTYNLKSKVIGQIPNKPELSDYEENLLGDIAISFDTCEREAIERNIVFKDHTIHLLVHGCLHLLNYDHINDADALIMEKLEARLLKKMGIADPYTENK
ncbi:rRNA maturation RNase YbeY [Amylibacter sp.]|nr:rRNA maturation RNase YbeY [Amylibacter sp.]